MWFWPNDRPGPAAIELTSRVGRSTDQRWPRPGAGALASTSSYRALRMPLTNSLASSLSRTPFDTPTTANMAETMPMPTVQRCCTVMSSRARLPMFQAEVMARNTMDAPKNADVFLGMIFAVVMTVPFDEVADEWKTRANGVVSLTTMTRQQHTGRARLPPEPPD